MFHDPVSSFFGREQSAAAASGWSFLGSTPVHGQLPYAAYDAGGYESQIPESSVSATTWRLAVCNLAGEAFAADGGGGLRIDDYLQVSLDFIKGLADQGFTDTKGVYHVTHSDHSIVTAIQNLPWASVPWRDVNWFFMARSAASLTQLGWQMVASGLTKAFVISSKVPQQLLGSAQGDTSFYLALTSPASPGGTLWTDIPWKLVSWPSVPWDVIPFAAMATPYPTAVSEFLAATIKALPKEACPSCQGVTASKPFPGGTDVNPGSFPGDDCVMPNGCAGQLGGDLVCTQTDPSCNANSEPSSKPKPGDPCTSGGCAGTINTSFRCVKTNPSCGSDSGSGNAGSGSGSGSSGSSATPYIVVATLVAGGLAWWKWG